MLEMMGGGGRPLGYLIRSTLQIHPFFDVCSSLLAWALYCRFAWSRSVECGAGAGAAVAARLDIRFTLFHHVLLFKKKKNPRHTIATPHIHLLHSSLSVHPV